jgi:carotenoid cleavage dioxygenase-like enzyme
MDVQVSRVIDDQAVRDSYRTGVYERATFETNSFELPVTGELPRELTGRYLRLGPNPVTSSDPAKYHWWLGDGMMHAVHLIAGRADWYRSRFMRTAQVAEAFGLPSAPTPAGRSVNTANTGPLVFRGETYATQEAGAIPLRLSGELESLEGFDFNGGLTGAFSGHCKLDPRTGELVAVVYDVMAWITQKRKPHLLVISPEGKVVREAPLEVEQVTMMHDCWITERFAAAFDLPVRIAPELAAEMPAPFTWDAALPSRIGLIDRRDPAAPQRWFNVKPCAIFHTLNGYEENGKVVLEAIRFERLFDRDKIGFGGDSPGLLHRWTLDLETGHCEEQSLDDCPGELPVVDPRRLGSAYRYGYWLRYDPRDHDKRSHRQLAFSWDTVCKLDRKTGKITRAPAPEGRVYGELLFVPRSADSDEDDGWLMGFRYRLDGGPTDLVILTAQDIAAEPVAVVHLPVRVPMGFHGWWDPDVPVVVPQK